MDEERISKKELLEQTGISYGQLYRWKRERLIPEEWFIKQSAFTGQETYFPREQVLTRVQAILSLKDTHSLDELAQLFSPEPGSVIAVEDLERFEELNQKLLALLQQDVDARETYASSEVVFLAALSRFIGVEGFDATAAALLAQRALSVARSKDAAGTNCTLFSSNAGEVGFHVVFHRGSTPPLFDTAITVIGTLALGETAELLGTFLQTTNQKA
jgi:DNA-binding transcriptional MerR regulator